MPGADSQLRIKCSVCGRQFYVESMSSRVPRHAPKEESEKNHPDYTPCGGSGARAIISGTKVRKLDDF